MVGFERQIYSTPEEDGSGQGEQVEVCIFLSGAVLERNVAVSLETSNGSAIGTQAPR